MGGCGCGGKKKKTKQSQVQPNVNYKPNGRGTVRLGLKEALRLPIRIPSALNGQDVVIVTDKNNIPPVDNALIIVGRNALVETSHKEQLVEKWPKAFNA
jgi:hypothetical protein